MRSSRSPVIFVALIAAAIAVPGAAYSQTVAPKPLMNPQPEAPTNRFGLPIEGFAIVRYTVRADGTTDNVRVTTRMPIQVSDGKVASAVEAWTFTPAMADGMPIEWDNNESVIVFKADPEAMANAFSGRGGGGRATSSPQSGRSNRSIITGRPQGGANAGGNADGEGEGEGEARPAFDPNGPGQMFIRGYREVEASLAAGEIEDAKKRNDRLLEMEGSKLSEFGVGLMQAARIDMLMDDVSAAYAAVRIATDPRLDLLQPSELPVALEYRNTLEMRLGDYVSALKTWERRQQVGGVSATDPMATQAPAIETALQGDAAIAIQAKIMDGTWSHELSRRTFALGDLEGSLKAIDIECDRRAAQFEASDESEFTLPDGWGACVVTISGKDDTKFSLYEFK
jgi:TonB family protein